MTMVRNCVDSLVHVTDWFPTMLSIASDETGESIIHLLGHCTIYAPVSVDIPHLHHLFTNTVSYCITLLLLYEGVDGSLLDGVDQWPTISAGAPSPKNEFIYHLDDSHAPVQGEAAIR